MRLATLLLWWLVVACAGTPPAADLSQYHAVFLQVTANDAFDPEDLHHLEASLIKAIQQGTPFETTATPSHDVSTLQIEVETVSIRRVSNALRISLGNTAGSNTISAWYTLRDGATGTELARFKLIANSPQRTAISPDWPWGDMETAMERMGRKLAVKLSSWYN